MMDDMLEGKVLSDVVSNRHLRKEGCGEIERIDIQEKREGRRLECLNSSHFLLTHGGTIDDQFKEDLKIASSQEPILPEETVISSFPPQNKPRDKHNEIESIVVNSLIGEGSVKTTSNPVINKCNLVDEDKTTTTNGCLTLKEESMSIHWIATTLNKHQNGDSRLSEKSGSSDEFLEECQSIPHISKSLSSELNANRSAERKHADDSSLLRRKHHVSKSSSEIHCLSRDSVSEKDHSKKKLSFRALVRMKGLGRKLRGKNQGKSKHKQVNNKTETQTRDPLFFSDSSAKYLLESSTSVTEEHSQYKQTITEDEPKPPKNKKSYSFSGNSTPDNIFQSDLDSTSSENICSAEYLQKRRYAVCEEIEKTIVCGEQTLAELRSILVIQHKLTGFGLL